MSNNRNLGNIATAITNATSGQVLTSQGSGVATFADAGGGVTYYANVSDLPSSGNSNGDAAFVGANNRLYVFNGAGWYSVALLNQTPTISSVADAGSNTTPFTLSSSGTATVITITATDSDGDALTYNYSVSSGALNGSTVTQNNNVFTVTPHASNAATFNLTFTVTDGINTATSAAQAFTLSFASWANATQQAKIQASNAGASDHYGYSVSISEDGSTAIVGAFDEDTSGTGAGSAYILTRSGTSWSEQAKIQSSDAAAYDYFGISVAISGDGNTVIAGARNENSAGTSAGAAYIFTKSGSSWSQQAKITSGGAGAKFGSSVSISDDGNTAIVGADGYNSNTGTAYICTRSGTSWSSASQLQASDATSNDFFGASVAISNDGSTAIIGAFAEDTTAVNAGSAYIFTGSGSSWSQQAKIQSSDAQSGDNFGKAVSISEDGDTAIIGAKGEDTTADSAGSAYIFTRSGTSWSQQAKIQASNAGSDEFGSSVSISNDGDTAIVGAIYEDTTASNAGSAYIFTRSGSTWSEQDKIQASDAQSNDLFGVSVAISGDGSTAIIGAYEEDTTASNAGSAYIFVQG